MIRMLVMEGMWVEWKTGRNGGVFQVTPSYLQNRTDLGISFSISGILIFIILQILGQKVIFIPLKYLKGE